MGQWNHPSTNRNIDVNGCGTVYKREYKLKSGGDATYAYVRPKLGSRKRDPQTNEPAVERSSCPMGKPAYVLGDYGLPPVWGSGGAIYEIVSGRDYPMGRVAYVEPADLGIHGPEEEWTEEERGRWQRAYADMARKNRRVNENIRRMLMAVVEIRRARLEADLEGMDFNMIAPRRHRPQFPARQPPANQMVEQ